VAVAVEDGQVTLAGLDKMVVQVVEVALKIQTQAHELHHLSKEITEGQAKVATEAVAVAQAQ
jgi:hypothetical protein